MADLKKKISKVAFQGFLLVYLPWKVLHNIEKRGSVKRHCWSVGAEAANGNQLKDKDKDKDSDKDNDKNKDKVSSSIGGQ